MLSVEGSSFLHAMRRAVAGGFDLLVGPYGLGWYCDCIEGWQSGHVWVLRPAVVSLALLYMLVHMWVPEVRSYAGSDNLVLIVG